VTAAAETQPVIRGPLRRVCIVMMSAAGDVVHVLPVVHALKRHAPEAHITWVLQPGPATLVHGHPRVDRIVVFERGRGRRAFADVRRELRAEPPFDVVLVMQDYLKAGLIGTFPRSPVRLGFDRARARDLTWLLTNRHLPPRPVRHMQDQFLEFAEALGAPTEPLVWDLGPWPQERAWQREFYAGIERPVAALVVGTSKPEKDWPAERWAEVVDALYERHGLQPVLVGGRSERELAAERVIMQRARNQPVSALGSGLRRLVAILDGAALVIAPDTGPLHIAVALDRPVIAMMGYTNPKRSGPYRRFQDLLIDAYGDPGEDYAASTQTRPGRMMRITVEDVLAKVARWEELYRGARGDERQL
jgi:heptosyltransferase I